jgi:outer membrane receptor protein involved in Fe transport
VTGSRIQRNGMESPTPVTSLTLDEIETLAPGPAMDALEQLPQFINNATVNNTGPGGGAFTYAGQSVLNLRGMGTNRTLVLLDGRRVVPSSRFSTVDIGAFPDAMIERVDVVTGGASAAYGSDAVSGVVNFRLNTGFTGIKAELQTGATGYGDHRNDGGSLLFGTDLGERAHLAASVEYYEADEVRDYRDRDWFQSWGVINNPDWPAQGPQRVTVPNVRSRVATYGGLIIGGPLRGTYFGDHGVPALQQAGAYVTSVSQAGGDGLDNGVDAWMMPQQKRTSAFANLSYRLNDDASFFVQALVGGNHTMGAKFPDVLVPPNQATIYRDNAYLPESVRQQMVALDVSSFPLGRISSPHDLASGIVTLDSRLSSFTTGLNFNIDGWRYNAYYQYGQTQRTVNFGNGTIVRLDRLYRAIDAVIDPASGAAVCRSTLMLPGDGCVPVNLFGDGSPSPQAKAYLYEGQTYEDQTLVQHVAEATVQGEPFSTHAGPIAVVAGASYRRDSLDQVPGPAEYVALSTPPASQLGYFGQPSSTIGDDIWELGNPDPVKGSYDVMELFTEGIVPLIRNVPFVRSLEVTAAARNARYSRTGGVWAWKAGVDWKPVNDLRLRATRSRDSRAGSLSERFDSSGGGTTVADPFRPNDDPILVIVVAGGNPDIKPEKADASTFGFVYEPAWLEGLGMSVDYYDVRINGAIAQLTPQILLDQCFAGVEILCEQISRAPDGRLREIRNSFLNIAEARTRGVDIEMSLARPVHVLGGNERLGLRAFVSHVAELSTTDIGAAKVDRAGQTGPNAPGLSGPTAGGAPSWQGTANVSYARGAFALSAQERFVGPGTYNAMWRSGVDIDDNTVAAAWYTHLRIGYTFETQPGVFEIFAHVGNVFDKAPARAATFSIFGGTAHTNPAYFDELGRRFTLGAQFSR